MSRIEQAHLEKVKEGDMSGFGPIEIHLVTEEEKVGKGGIQEVGMSS